MCKTKIFAEVLKAVSVETEIPEDMILSKCRSMEVVDARSVLVKILSEKGLYPVQIAYMLHKTPASVRNLLSNYDIRKVTNKMIEIYSQNIRKLFENI